MQNYDPAPTNLSSTFIPLDMTMLILKALAEGTEESGYSSEPEISMRLSRSLEGALEMIEERKITMIPRFT